MIDLPFAMLLAWAGAAQDTVPMRVPHPSTACWIGVRSRTSQGQPQSELVTYDTDADIRPYLVTHNRDQIRRGPALEQDYNFIDYWFGDPASPIRARYYLRADESVTVTLPGDAGQRLSLDEARERFPADILCYLQRRFDRIEILVADGARELWARPE